MNDHLPIRVLPLLALGLAVLLMGCSAEPSSRPQSAASPAQAATVDQVCGTAAELLGVDRSKVTADTSLEDLNADELDFIELVMELEDTFHITITDEAAEEMMGTSDWPRGMKQVTMSKLAVAIEKQQRQSVDHRVEQTSDERAPE